MSKSVLIKDGTLITMNPARDVVDGDLLIVDGKIAEVAGKGLTGDETIDAAGCAVLPGFVQTHVHLCQTLFRGAADDLQLIDWLKKRVWPLEAAHSAESLRASALLGIAELVRGGTTCALTMESVNHTEEVFKVVETTGFRATVGKCMMDKGEDVPAGLREQTRRSIEECVRLLERWDGASNGRIRYCFAPRFAVSCTEGLLREVSALAKRHNVLVHTHASENLGEIEIVERETGKRNIDYLHDVGISGPNVVLAHCVHVNDREVGLLAGTGTHVAHCPSSNLKLGSGIARIVEMKESGVSVSFGADGAPCNNRLDMFTEMRTAALLQKVRRGADALPAKTVLQMATLDGARALGLAESLGSLEVGKDADVTIVDVSRLHMTPRADIISTLVYAATAADVRSVLVTGEVLMRDRQLTTIDEHATIEEANDERTELFARAGI